MLAGPASAEAAPGQESIFMDDTELVFGTDQEVEATFVILRQLGVDRVRVSLLWYVVAPDPESQTRPLAPAPPTPRPTHPATGTSTTAW